MSYLYHSALLDINEKTMLKESLVKYVSYLQKRYFKDKNISEDFYHGQMDYVQSVVDKLHLNDLYKQ